MATTVISVEVASLQVIREVIALYGQLIIYKYQYKLQILRKVIHFGAAKVFKIVPKLQEVSCSKRNLYLQFNIFMILKINYNNFIRNII